MNDEPRDLATEQPLNRSPVARFHPLAQALLAAADEAFVEQPIDDPATH